MILHCSENENEYANALRWRDGRDWLVYRPRFQRRSFARMGQEWGEIFGQRSQKSLRPLSRLQRRSQTTLERVRKIADEEREC